MERPKNLERGNQERPEAKQENGKWGSALAAPRLRGPPELQRGVKKRVSLPGAARFAAKLQRPRRKIFLRLGTTPKGDSRSDGRARWELRQQKGGKEREKAIVEAVTREDRA